MPSFTQESRIKIDLCLQPQFLNTLTNQEIEFAQKQHQRIYSEQMAKLSVHIQRNKRFNKRISSIQKAEKDKFSQSFRIIKQREQHYSINKNKNQQKKIKQFKLQQQLWKIKVNKIKTNQKHQAKMRLEQISILDKNSQQYWKQKQMRATSSRIKQNSRHKSQIYENDSIINKQANSKERKRQDNQTYLSIRQKSNKTLVSNRTTKIVHQKYAHFLTGEYDSSKQIYDQSGNAIKQNKHRINNNQLNQDLTKDKVFQKTMIKLDKIRKLKQIHQKINISKVMQPTKPRKSIQSQTYRALRSKTQGAKNIKNISYNQQTQTIKQGKNAQKQAFFNESNSKVIMNKSYSYNIDKKRLIFDQELKKRDQLKQIHNRQFKKDKILKAIKKNVQIKKYQQIKRISMNN